MIANAIPVGPTPPRNGTGTDITALPVTFPAPTSAVKVAVTGGQSRLVRSVSQDPLKVIPTRSEGADCCSVVISNYGGGFVQGDDARLTVDCSAGGRLYVGTQALNKVYRCPDLPARQSLVGRVERGGRVASLPDPVMLYAGSRFEQRQAWDVAEGAVLAVADGMVSGRRERGEAFAFTSYRSELRVLRDGRPVAVENVRCEPGRLDPLTNAVFGGHHVSMMLMIVGTEGEPCYETTANAVSAAVKAADADEVAVVFARPKPDVVVVRMLAAGMAAADKAIRGLCGCTADAMLGFDPMTRKA